MSEIRDCPAPDPHPGGPTRYAVPPGAVDTHAHVIGLPPAYPFVSERSYTPPEAPAAHYLAMLDATGMAHGVLVQVSVHGTDNRLMVETLQANRQRLRGIAVIPLGLPERDLIALKEAGVRGLRLNVLFGGGVGLDQLEDYGALAREMGWHLQFLLDARHLPPMTDALSRLKVPLVFDHMGHMPASAGIEHPGFQTLLGLVRDGAYVKLSGAFRVSTEGAPYTDTIPFARALNDAAPERCLWGSDWPHVAAWDGPPKLPALLDLMAEWVPDEERRRMLFVDNPKRLYGF
ncbi:amidohydrolase family protein [Methylobacterium sp. NFXW15]|uniref:amidohydrolase family protein n=1 Tax=Methylobacterium sp. NFXW15 TaxID=2819512 RepID=UPI003CF29C38